MSKKKHSLSEKVTWILIFTLAISFASGCFSLWQVEKSNSHYIYQLTGELMNSSVRQMEEQLTDIQDILYSLVVSDEIQEAGSLLIRQSSPSSAMQQDSCLNTIVECIQNGIKAEHSIVCANFLNASSYARVAATTQYYRLSEEAARAVSEAAVQAAGKTILLDGGKLVNENSILVVAKQLREKKDLSLEHIGVIVLFVDIESLGSVLTNMHDGIFILQSQDGALKYILNDSENLIQEYPSPEDAQEGYHIQRLGNEQFFQVVFRQSNAVFSYILLTPYSELFGNVHQNFSLHVGIFILCSLAAMLIAFLSTRRVTRDIQLFIQHVHGIPGEDLTRLPLYENENIRDRDVYALQQAFNSMSSRINELVRDNYTKQLQVKETQLQALQAQMNPHFLYNTLNSLYWMTKTGGMPAAADMVSSLSILMREAISDKEFVITIDRELDIVCHYLTIQKHRYEDRLRVEFDVSGECSHLMIPKFSIQPLVENAIAYGLECMLGICTIKVRCFLQEKDCICQVLNDGPVPAENLMDRLKDGTMKPNGNGIGLMNIQQRIVSVFGEEYGIHIFRQEEHTVAQLRIKCVSAAEYQEGKQNGQALQNHDRG